MLCIDCSQFARQEPQEHYLCSDVILHWELTDMTTQYFFLGKVGENLLSDIVSTEDFGLSIDLAKTGTIF